MAEQFAQRQEAAKQKVKFKTGRGKYDTDTYNPVTISKTRSGGYKVVSYRMYSRGGKKIVKPYRTEYYSSDKKLESYRVTARNTKGLSQGAKRYDLVSGTVRSYERRDVEPGSAEARAIRREKFAKPTTTASTGVSRQRVGRGTEQPVYSRGGIPEQQPTVTREDTGEVVQRGGQTVRRLPRYGAERPETTVVYTATKGGKVVQFKDEKNISSLQAQGYEVTGAISQAPRESELRREVVRTQTPLTSTQIGTVTGTSNRTIEYLREDMGKTFQGETVVARDIRPSEAALLTGQNPFQRAQKKTPASLTLSGENPYSGFGQGRPMLVTTGAVVNQRIVQQGSYGAPSVGSTGLTALNKPLRKFTNQPTIRTGFEATAYVGKGFQREGGRLASGERDLFFIKGGGEGMGRTLGTSVKTVGESFEYLGTKSINDPSRIALLYGGGAAVGAVVGTGFKGATSYMSLKALSGTTTAARVGWGAGNVGLQAVGVGAGGLFAYTEGKDILSADKPGARATESLIKIRGFTTGSRVATKYFTPTTTTIKGRYTNTLIAKDLRGVTRGTITTKGTFSVRKFGKDFKVPYKQTITINGGAGVRTVTFGKGMKGLSRFTTTEPLATTSFSQTGLTQQPSLTMQTTSFARGQEVTRGAGKIFYGTTTAQGTGGRQFFGTLTGGSTAGGRLNPSRFTIQTAPLSRTTTPTRGLFVAGVGSNLQPSLIGSTQAFTNPFAGNVASTLSPSRGYNVGFLGSSKAGLPSLAPPIGRAGGIFPFGTQKAGFGSFSRPIQQQAIRQALPVRSQAFGRTIFEPVPQSVGLTEPTTEPVPQVALMFDTGSTGFSETKIVGGSRTTPIDPITPPPPPPPIGGGGFFIPPLGIPPGFSSGSGKTRRRGYRYAPSLLGILSGKRRSTPSKTTFGLGIRGI